MDGDNPEKPFSQSKYVLWCRKRGEMYRDKLDRELKRQQEKEEREKIKQDMLISRERQRLEKEKQKIEREMQLEKEKLEKLEA